jgi:hypothetical protein
MPLYNPVTASSVSGLGTAAVKNTGTSGDAVPLLNATTNTFGSGGAGGAVATVAINGGSGSNGGPLIRLNRDGVTTGYIGTDSSLNGGASNDMALHSVSGVVQLHGNAQPDTDDTYYLGRNSATSPKAWKGLILKDQSNGNYYRITSNAGALTLTAL